MLNLKLELNYEGSTWFYMMHAIIIVLSAIYMAIFVKDTTNFHTDYSQNQSLSYK
jgi:hypothetical protein